MTIKNRLQLIKMNKEPIGYKNDNGYYHYPDEIMRDMEDYMVSLVSRYVEKDKIFLWERQEK